MKKAIPNEEYPGCWFWEGSYTGLNLTFSDTWSGIIPVSFDIVSLGYVENLQITMGSATEEYLKDVSLARVGMVDIIPDSFVPNAKTALRSVITFTLSLPYESSRCEFALDKVGVSKKIIDTTGMPIVGAGGDFLDTSIGFGSSWTLNIRVSTENIAEQAFDWQAPGSVEFLLPLVVDIPCNPI